MRVLMLGWEFPPYLSGGLGTACYGITKALISRGTDVIFVLPLAERRFDPATGVELRSASGTTVPVLLPGKRGSRRALPKSWTPAMRAAWRVEGDALETVWHGRLKMCPIASTLTPYATEASYAETLSMTSQQRRLRLETELETIVPGHEGPQEWESEPDGPDRRSTEVLNLRGGYGADLMGEVYRYSRAVTSIALHERFDVIHAHDWMTYPAAMLVKSMTGKPLVVHIHAMEADRSGMGANQTVSAIERAGMEAADRVVAVSHYTRSQVMRCYGIPKEKISVVHNAVNRKESAEAFHLPPRGVEGKQVLFMGRITFQKGPEYFVEAARMVLDRLPATQFVMAGSGDMMNRMVRRVGQLRMGSRFHFTGFLSGEDVDRMYATSDLYVMPSVSEPFGIAPLEAMLYDVPAIISRQSGVSEVVHNALKVNFWDVTELANMICAVLTRPPLAAEMVRNCREELKSIRWERAAEQLQDIYAQVTGKR